MQPRWFDVFRTSDKGDTLPVVMSVPESNVLAKGNIGAVQESVVIVIPAGVSAVGLELSGTWVGQIEFEALIRNTWVSVYASNTATSSSAVTSNGIFILPGAGYRELRARASAWTSGTAHISFNASIGAGPALLSAPLPAGTNVIGKVAGGGNSITQTPTVTVGAYSALDAVGGLLTFASAARAAAGMGVVESVVIVDNASQNAEMCLFLFDQTFTAMADNAPFDPSDADLANCVGFIYIGAGDYKTLTDNSVAVVTNQPLMYKLAAAGTSLFGQLRCAGTPTYVATSDVIVKLVVRYVD